MLTKKGLTWAELLVAVAILMIVLAATLVLWGMAEKAWYNERARSDILAQLEISMERIKREMTMTDSYQIIYYPAGASTFTAVSFPMAEDDDNDGFIELDALGDIDWDRTVIYHLCTNAQGEKELRRTIFDPRSGALTAAQRAQQLSDVVSNGQPISSTWNYASWDQDNGTTVICKGVDIVFTLTPKVREFDGYSASTGRSEDVTFGSVPLTAGSHYITFKVIGDSPGSAGDQFRLGIDSFSISPSGCDREAEEAGQPAVNPDSGDSKVNEDMTSFGSWNANRHLEYRATGEDDFISFDFYNDEWIETNFATCSPSDTLIDYSNRTGDGSEESGIDDYVLRLGGFGDSWSALNQTGAAAKSAESVNVTGSDGVIFRTFISSEYIEVEGTSAKITFDNTSAAAITIDYAGIMEHYDGPDGVNGTLVQITFPDGSGGSSTSVTIVGGGSVESDWINVGDFSRNRSYLLTIHLPLAATPSPNPPHTVSGWVDSEPLNIHTYVLEGDIAAAQAITWGAYTPDEVNAIYTIDSINASYYSNGSTVSQIYDTKLDDPDYGTLTWTMAKNNYGDYGSGGLGANLVLRVRAGDDEDALKASGNWSSAVVADTLSASGSTSLNSLDNNRYVQFRADFTSSPSVPGGADFLKSCVLKNLSIRWLGETVSGGSTMVDAGGYFTTRPTYGIFTVEVDGEPLTKGLDVKLEISEDVLEDTITRSLTSEVEPRNTGK